MRNINRYEWGIVVSVLAAVIVSAPHWQKSPSTAAAVAAPSVPITAIEPAKTEWWIASHGKCTKADPLTPANTYERNHMDHPVLTDHGDEILVSYDEDDRRMQISFYRGEAACQDKLQTDKTAAAAKASSLDKYR